MSVVQFKTTYVSLSTPFDEEYARDIHGLGGCWFNNFLRCWMIPVHNQDAARGIALHHFGSDGTIDDQVQLHIELKPGVVVEVSDKVLKFDGWSVLHMLSYRAVIAELVSFKNVEPYARKIAVGDWRLGLRVLSGVKGHIVLKPMGIGRAGRARTRYFDGQLDGQWREAVEDVCIERFGADRTELYERIVNHQGYKEEETTCLSEALNSTLCPGRSTSYVGL